MPPATPRRLKALGKQLRERREELGYPTMTALYEATEPAVRPSYTIMMASENGTRGNISERTWKAVAATYWVTPESILAVLAGQARYLRKVEVSRAEHHRALGAAAAAGADSLGDAASVIAILAAPDPAAMARGARLLAAMSADMRGLSAPAQVLAALAKLDRPRLLECARVLSGLAAAAQADPLTGEAVSPAPRAAG